MILYPTETVYALGVHVFDTQALHTLYQIKGREVGKLPSWLVRTVADIERYAVLSSTAASIAERFLPGPLTLVLPLRDSYIHIDGTSIETIGFRITPDPVGQQLIADFMNEFQAPLTCTSANRSGLPTKSTVIEICAQFKESAVLIDRIIDDGPRSGVPSTAVRVIGDTVEVIREGGISAEML
ncbi:MAG: L-threonylcarbamoyladenylate synthase [Patescibacteria group bacterium]